MNPRGAEDLNELRFCHVIGGSWRVPLPGGAEADLARALAAARPAPGLRLPQVVMAGIAGLPALVRPGAAVLLADAARAEPALFALAEWLHWCRCTGRDGGSLSLIQPISVPFQAQWPGWRAIPLFSGDAL